ncbi:MAG: hypothetical protein MRY79_05790 [Alphaproteobacteria bacterium]|nr:hypothetical protein [Alphaproteobacteria bacterium]
MNQNDKNAPHLTRIIPGLTAEYQIVSLPYWAWFWLDDFMQTNKIGYKGIYQKLNESENINSALQTIAEFHHEQTMRGRYNLANDNDIPEEEIFKHLQQKRTQVKTRDLNLPKIYKLFGFMPCATTLEAVWQRRNRDDLSNMMDD